MFAEDICNAECRRIGVRPIGWRDFHFPQSVAFTPRSAMSLRPSLKTTFLNLNPIIGAAQPVRKTLQFTGRIRHCPPESGGQRHRVFCDDARGGSPIEMFQNALLKNSALEPPPARSRLLSRSCCPPDSGGQIASVNRRRACGAFPSSGWGSAFFCCPPLWHFPQSVAFTPRSAMSVRPSLKTTFLN